MKVAILAGGRGTRLGAETTRIPKPMVEIGGRPILWHILRHYSCYGYNDFVVALGFRGEVIKRYMLDYRALAGNLSVDFRTGEVVTTTSNELEWRVDLVETGSETETGSRIRKLAPYLGGRPFMLTYGDGVADLDVAALVQFHRENGCLATLTAVRPVARFGHLEFEGERVVRFSEKPQLGEGWINGGFFVLEPEVLDYIGEGEQVSFERDVLERLAKEGQLVAYRHRSFWQCMDTPRDKRLLESLWETGDAPWKLWK